MQSKRGRQNKLQEKPEQSFGGRLMINSEMLWVMNQVRQNVAPLWRIWNTGLEIDSQSSGKLDVGFEEESSSRWPVFQKSSSGSQGRDLAFKSFSALLNSWDSEFSLKILSVV